MNFYTIKNYKRALMLSSLKAMLHSDNDGKGNERFCAQGKDQDNNDYFKFVVYENYVPMCRIDIKQTMRDIFINGTAFNPDVFVGVHSSCACLFHRAPLVSSLDIYE